MKLLILNTAILAADPVETADDFRTADAIYPKHVIAGYELVDVAIDPVGFVPSEWEYIGGVVVKKPPVVVTAPVPESVSPRQIRQALSRAGLRSVVELAIGSGDQDMKDWYEYATEFRRDNPLIPALAAEIGVTSEQVDDLWRLAATL